MNYVCGFLFSPNRTVIALIEKQKPEWQKGKLNGIGGKIEPNETSWEAMAREFREEANAWVPPEQWTLFRREVFANQSPDGGLGAAVHFFYAVATEQQWGEVRTVEQEKVIAWRGGITDPKLMYNLRYLIPMAETLMDQPPENVPQP